MVIGCRDPWNIGLTSSGRVEMAGMLLKMWPCGWIELVVDQFHNQVFQRLIGTRMTRVIFDNFTMITVHLKYGSNVTKDGFC